MNFFNDQSKIDFMSIKSKAMIFSIVLSVMAVFSLFFYGLNLSLDFTGGTQIRLKNIEMDATQVRVIAQKEFGNDVVVQGVGSGGDFLIRIGGNHSISNQEKIAKDIKSQFGANHFSSITYIGPQIGSQLLINGLIATCIALLSTMLYIILRFEVRFGLSAMLALLHDPILILGCFAFFGLEFDINALAAIMTVIGYSLNDTIVVYDRVKENFLKNQKMTPSAVVNLSINQTLSRTIMTSGLTLLVVLSLLIFGGDQLFCFALSLAIGIIIGTYSSIYIAGSLAVTLGLTRDSLLPKSREYLKLIP